MLIQGHGVNDMPRGSCKKDGKICKFYRVWSSMLERCYSETLHKRCPTYIGCSVAEEWLILSNFKKWFEVHYIEGYQLDKDLLVEGNKTYGPDTCIFVTGLLNNLFTDSAKIRGECPIGVAVNKRSGKYVANLKMYGRKKWLGQFNTPEEAHQAYIKAKREYVLEVVEMQRGIDNDRVLDVIYEKYSNMETPNV